MTVKTAIDTTDRWRSTDDRHHLHPFTDFKALHEEGGSRVITSGEGIWLTDSEGRRILDGMAGLWCVNVGYGREELARAAYEQMRKLAYYNTFFKTTTPPAAELSEKLVSLTPKGLDHVFFANSGSEANDTIVRTVRRYWALEGKPEKKIMLSRKFAYHGSTLAAASLGGMKHMHELDGLPLPGFEHIEHPDWYADGGGMSAEEYGLKAARALEAKIEELGAETIAAFIGEPVQGAGGVLVPPESYWPEIQRICRKHDILLIADEVICGFGRTGNWFGSETYGIEPDLMAMAKGITSGYVPLSAMLVGKRVGEALMSAPGEFAHGFTYSGHPVACAVALANIELMERESLVERVRKDIGPYFQSRLAELSDHPLVGEVRGVGLLGAVRLVADKGERRLFDPVGKAANLTRDYCFKDDLIARAVNDAMVLSPPLVISKEEVDELVRRLRRNMDRAANELGYL